MAQRNDGNRLAGETSLYLRQHAMNPVDWYPWCEEALSRAREEDRPILLSVGYSACHWCHVMEHECFENEEIAALMNELFICVKVDREQRPDIDALYMKALQAMTGRGGWPMTIFLAPDGRPFYAGTYFPPEDRGSMPAFPRVLRGVSSAWATQREKVLESGDRVVEFLCRPPTSESSGSLAREDILTAAKELEGLMDQEWGGFGSAPKFPSTMCLDLLLAVQQIEPTPSRDAMIRRSLDAMAVGGMRDHLGGGFHRYSVDRQWLVPHFEKMLYDQAQMAMLYAEGWKRYRRPLYKDVALEVVDYVLREMVATEGGFYSAQDADSEGVEGKFFVWSRAEILEVLGAADGQLFCETYGVTEEGNFEGANILNLRGSATRIEEAAPAASDVAARLENARRKLFERRAGRIPPARDEKVMADWNGLMIATLVRLGRLFEREYLVAAACRALDFVRRTMLQSGRVLHTAPGGSMPLVGFLDDQAFVGRAALECFLATGRTEDLELSEFCATALLTHFSAGDAGGFWFTADDGEALVARSRDLHDGAVPSGNSVAAELLLRLWQLTGEDRYRLAGEATMAAFLADARRNPHGAAYLLGVAERHRRGYVSVVLVGDAGALTRAALETAAAEVSVLRAPPGGTGIALTGNKVALQGLETAYVCRGTECAAPVTTVAELDELLERSGRG